MVVASFTGAAGAVAAGDDGSVVALLAGQAGFWTVLVAVVIFDGSQAPGGEPAKPLARTVRWFDIPVGAMVGAATQFVLLPLLYLPFRGFFDEDDLSAPAEDLLSGLTGGGLVAMGLGVVVVAPVVEELFFRGLLLEAMRYRWNTTVAVAASSVVFGATHFQPLQFAGLTLAGLVFAGAVVRTGRIGSAICVHAGFNAATFAILTVL
ncbi:MAG: CPBP family intramembrane metalloprotease [Acidimicrobiales bacterium]|nr:CPBP family intramembrane metalloprotease [Acidimicrobiales bacterium]